MKSIRLRAKLDVLASEDFFFASMASRPLCFLALALLLLLAFVESGAFTIGLSFAGDGLANPAPPDSDRVLFLGASRGIRKRVTLLQDSHL